MIIQIEQQKELKLENLLSLRKKMTQQEMNQEIMEIGKLLQGKDVQKDGPTLTTTFSIEVIDGEQVMDTEILIPLNKKINLPQKYNLKEIFHLKNALYARHEGNPVGLQEVYNQLNNYALKNNLRQISSGYNVYVKDLQQGQSIDDMIIDIYIGIDQNIL